jgi:hypothetical protein
MTTETTEQTALELEKKICAALGKEWRPTGMSIVTLVDELISEYERLRHDR